MKHIIAFTVSGRNPDRVYPPLQRHQKAIVLSLDIPSVYFLTHSIYVVKKFRVS